MHDQPAAKEAQQLLMNKIIAGALMVGTVVITGVLVAITGGTTAPFSVVSLVGLVIGLGALAASFIVPDLVARSPATAAAGGKNPVLEKFTTSTIVRFALLEGAAVVNAILFMVEPWWPQLGVVGLMLVVMAMHFPTDGRWRDFLEAREREAQLGER